MFLLLLSLFILIAVVVLLFYQPISILFYLDTNKMDMRVVMRWIPFFRIELTVITLRLFITVFFLKKQIYTHFMKPKKKGKSQTTIFKAVALSNTSVKLAYGFNEPYLTGLFLGVAEFIGSLIKSADIELEPAFIPENEYLIINAKTDLNAGKTLITLLKLFLTRTADKSASLFLNRNKYQNKI